MKRQHLFIIYLSTSLLILICLIWLTYLDPPDLAQLLPAVLFGALIVFTDTFGVLLVAGSVSLLPMATVAGYLVMGPAMTGWAAFVGALLHGVIRSRWAEQLQIPRSPDRMYRTALTAGNVTMHTASVLVGSAVFQAMGGTTPLTSLDLAQVLPLVLLGATYMLVTLLLATPAIIIHGRETLLAYLRSTPNILFYEGGPLIFAPLVALIYTRLGVAQFMLFALLLVLASLIARGLAHTSRRLERRVKELDGLQAVGQALSASLNLDAILSAIHTQVAALMPAENFYVALYNLETTEVSFPLAFEDGNQARWKSRRAGTGLTEHVLQTRQPLLISKDVAAVLQELGIASIGRQAASWLGVPILAEGQPIGVIAIQSYTKPEAYDASHQEILVTIASQAAVAIQNARLYERTDEALARRVQELNSILRSTREGILLLDTDWEVLAANRTLADFLSIAQAEMVGQSLTARRPEGPHLITLIGYTPRDLEKACAELSQEDASYKQTITVPGPPERQVERTLTPVRDRDGYTSGWLFIFRDIMEEIELARLRDDLTHMLVHDLRSPLTVLNGGLDMLESTLAAGDKEEANMLLQLARRGSDQLLYMVNELLDISKLESGQLPLQPESIRVEELLKEAAAHLAHPAAEAHITIETAVAPDLPPLHVDGNFIGRVLHNLMDNAIKFTPDDGLIRLWAKPDAGHDPPALLVGVTDTGPGIPPEEQRRLFEKFQQVSSVTGRRSGTGLGLPFCKLVVEAHGGQIWVESEAGKGSTFVMRLPTAGVEAVPTE